MTQLTNSNQRQITFQGQMQDLNRRIESKRAMQKQLMAVIRRSGRLMCELGGEIRDLEKEKRRLEIKNDNERRYNL